MNVNVNKEKDFIDNFLDFLEPYKKAEIRIVAILICFALFFLITFLVCAPLLYTLKKSLNFSIDIMQTSPLEAMFSYIKLSFFSGLFFTFPLFIYQFGKIKINQEKIEHKINLFYLATVLFSIIFVAMFLSAKLFMPLEYKLLYALNFNVAEMTTSLSAIVSTFIFNIFIISMVGFLPVIYKLSEKKLFFDYDTLIKYRKTVVMYFTIIVLAIALPVELVALVLLFLIFFSWYKIVIMMIKKREDDEEKEKRME